MWQPSTNTPSAPVIKAFNIISAETRPEHITRTGKMLGGDLKRATPALSAPA
jgi:hypothetical protein